MKYFKRISEYVFDSSRNIRDRYYVLFGIYELSTLLVAGIYGVLLLDKKPLAFLISASIVFLFFVYMYFEVKKNKVHRARIVISTLLVFFLQPITFFTKGGVSGGALIIILLGSFFVMYILDGKLRIFMVLSNGLIIIACGVLSYYRPDMFEQYSRKATYIDSIGAFVIGNLLLAAMGASQTRIYQKENDLAREKAKELEEMNRSQNRFFSSMSHEIRTPINTVLGLNEIILRQEDASEEIKKDARNIQGAGKMLLALINDILDVSKIEAGKMDIVPVNYNVSDLLSEIVNMIWLKAEEKGLKFNVDIDPAVPEMLFGDEVRIKQILINLLNNAVKYTKEGSVTLHMECDFPSEAEALFKINVSDTGMGIKAEALPHLFDTFQRQDEEKNRHIEGTGLGLSIVKQLVELMDGEIKVSSVYGQGSVFSVTLKQGISSDKRIGEMKIRGAGSLSDLEKFEHRFHAPDARILIVDDNDMNLQVEKKLLDGTDMTIDLALSGQEALTQTLRNRYDVIFMDHLMPEMDGIECYEKIRRQKGGMNTNVPMIVLTANAGGENIELYNNTGFDGYLVKPVSGAALEEMLLKHLPSDKVIGAKGDNAAGSLMNTGSKYARKKPIVIATSTMCDLPQYVLRELDISIIPYTLITDEGVFYDTFDIDSEELVRYMREQNKVVLSEPPTEEALVNFFSSELSRAHNLIYITLTQGSSREYKRAVNAAKTFENVTVVNSECLSSGTGILVMIAARLAQQNLSVERIKAELEEVKHLIKCSFVIKTTDVMARRERISTFMNNVLNTLWMRPVLRTKNDNLGVGGFLFGSEKKCYEKYIKKAFPSNVYPDTSFVFVTYAGFEEEDLMWIEEKLGERMKFEHVIFQKASAGITSNCGEGTFGLLYLIKGNHNYNLGPLFAGRDEEGEFIDDIHDEGPENKAEVSEEIIKSESDVSQAQEENKSEPKWYENIDGIDPKAAIKNSGSEAALESVMQMFYESYDARSEEIRNFYDAEDWENYTIKVHALKSSSRLVGAVKLGDDAEALEMAGKNSDIAFIRENHDKLMELYQTIREGLTPVFGASEDLPDIPSDILMDAYGGLSEFAQTKDYELARMIMDSIREYKLPAEDEERFKRIQTCLSRMDWDGICEILSEVM